MPEVHGDNFRFFDDRMHSSAAISPHWAAWELHVQSSLMLFQPLGAQWNRILTSPTPTSSMGSTGMTAISMFDYSAQWSSHQSYEILDLETVPPDITHILMQNTKCSKESQYEAFSSLHKICMQTSQPLYNLMFFWPCIIVQTCFKLPT